ncbi:MAG: hypothetical protein J7L22_07040 [Candidatus Marinimicrobia bacterium]|nr:hypothetical protein [Candidatus Neomarinimicrobiota bacterium]
MDRILSTKELMKIRAGRTGPVLGILLVFFLVYSVFKTKLSIAGQLMSGQNVSAFSITPQFQIEDSHLVTICIPIRKTVFRRLSFNNFRIGNILQLTFARQADVLKIVIGMRSLRILSGSRQRDSQAVRPNYG